MKASVYSVEQLGDNAGLKGWWAVLRNGQPIHHFATKEEAWKYVSDQSLKEWSE